MLKKTKILLYSFYCALAFGCSILDEDANPQSNAAKNDDNYFQDPSYIKVAKASSVGDQPSLFVCNNGSNTVTVCKIKDDGSLNECVVNHDETFAFVSSIVVNQKHSKAYILNNETNGKISVCSIGSDGSLVSCHLNDGNKTITNPDFIDINSDNTYVYIVDSSSKNTITICKVDNSGDLSGCSVDSASSLISYPIYIKSVEMYGKKYVYIINGDGLNKIVKCESDTNSGTLFGCISSDGFGGFNTPNIIDFDANKKYAYVSNFDSNTVSYCKLDADGNFVSCSQTIENQTFGNIVDLEIISGNKKIYFSSADGGHLSRCDINEDTGEPTNCLKLKENEYLYVSNLELLDNQGIDRVYMLSQTKDAILVCDMAIDGTLQNCK